MQLDREGLLQKLYSAALLEGGLTGVLADLAIAFPDLPISYQAQCVYQNEFYDCAFYNHGPDVLEKLSRVESANPFPPIALNCDVSDIVQTAHTISPQEMEKTDFYDEFCRENIHINRATGIILHRQGADSAFVAANFPKEFSDEDEARANDVMRFLRPHFQGAFKLLLEVRKREVNTARYGFWLEQIPTPAFVVDGGRRLIHMNTLAEQTLKRDDALTTSPGAVLTSSDILVRKRIEDAIGRAQATSSPVGPVFLRGPGQRGSFFFVLPVRPEGQVHPSLAPFLGPRMPFLVTYFNPEDRPKTAQGVLAGALGVTERESALLQELIYGSSLREAADRLGIAYNTARNQLASVHTKTGTRSQSDVVRMGAQLLARLPGTPELGLG
ncbi:helix-turn-helix transcriptional regulator [Roseibium aggregatum]|uniref:Helix-turn-helix transcriptional regulator n=1 Tax=Roseibium aggregatum TaxID=187304 RepID=A0A926S5F5_9HYPH|nr:helix-turn-helix transcriptional regulator [Roseibium aggregatum]MBD1546426.1 helix-turn-helix transcriptional regulator [Roseibium aggregatum]